MSNARNLANIASKSSDLKAGTTAFFAMSSAPSGWIKANGAAVSRTAYADLFAAIGTTFGAGDGSTTFNVPDLRGEFPRGLDDGRGIDSGRTIGTNQGGAFQSHSHSNSTTTHNGGGDLGPYPLALNSGYPANGYGSMHHVISVNEGQRNIPYGVFNIGNSGGSETRPRNVALLACIKY